MRLLVGTSGWQYDDWRGPFYPAGLAKRAWLAHYFSQFDVLEVDATFYRLPTADTVTRWAQAAPPQARFAVKASRYLTHVRRLRDPGEPVRRLLGVLAPLGDRLGAVLLQLPPNLPANPAALQATLDCFPDGVRVAVEPREASWFSIDVRGVLERRGAALVWAERAGQELGPLWRTADWGYLRLHEGRSRTAWPSYGRRALGTWLGRVEASWPEGEVLAFFNNDTNAAAPRDALTLRRMAARRNEA